MRPRKARPTKKRAGKRVRINFMSRRRRARRANPPYPKAIFYWCPESFYLDKEFIDFKQPCTSKKRYSRTR